MKDGYYWVRFSPKMNGWVMMTVSNGYIYKKTYLEPMILAQ